MGEDKTVLYFTTTQLKGCTQEFIDGEIRVLHNMYCVFNTLHAVHCVFNKL